MAKKINGLHHITALASDPQKNFNFYTKVLGLRFVKKTVNFDAPDVYHFYFADEVGTPGTVLTFFPFPNARQGKRGIGEASIVSFAIPAGSMEFWAEWLSKNDVSFSGPDEKFGFRYITFLDPDGMQIEVVEDEVKHLVGWETADIPREYSIRKFFGVTVNLKNSQQTESLISEVMGFELLAEKNSTKRFVSGEGDNIAYLDIRVNADGNPAVQSAGSVHHIAWRTENHASQLEWINRIRAHGLQTTDVIDRNYFHSIYFREPGGVLFEIATDGPGFMVDEDKESLGKALKLPAQYESRREHIESMLIPIKQ